MVRESWVTDVVLGLTGGSLVNGGGVSSLCGVRRLWCAWRRKLVRAGCLSDTSAHVLLFLVQPLRLQRRKERLPCREEEEAGPQCKSSSGRRRRAGIIWERRPSRQCRVLGAGGRHQHVGMLCEHGDREQQERADGAGQRRPPAAGVDALVRLAAVAVVAQQVPCGLRTIKTRRRA
ncbi:hypothetical protein BHE74_00056690 [Ensete ventricosum]|nr:hypothetical protein BHE74_00056690 [Ensete ventricosum]